MNGTKLLLDTNIVLYWLRGDKTLADLLHQKQIYLSFITELEVLGYSGLSQDQISLIHEFLSDCNIIDINSRIKSLAVKLRQTSKLKLPDSIILATSLYLDIPFVTLDADFKKIENAEIIYYEQ